MAADTFIGGVSTLTSEGRAMRIHVEERISHDGSVRIVLHNPYHSSSSESEPMYRPSSFEVGYHFDEPMDIIILHRGKPIYSHTCDFVVDKKLVTCTWDLERSQCHTQQMHIEVRNPTPRSMSMNERLHLLQSFVDVSAANRDCAAVSELLGLSLSDAEQDYITNGGCDRRVCNYKTVEETTFV
jgi:hypothetical protein